MIICFENAAPYPFDALLLLNVEFIICILDFDINKSPPNLDSFSDIVVFDRFIDEFLDSMQEPYNVA